jgi:hypothetical protein
MKQLDIICAHEPGFHQADPSNYHPTRLGHDEAISFHKFKQAYDRVKEEWGMSTEATVAMYNEFLVKSETGTGTGTAAGDTSKDEL